MEKLTEGVVIETGAESAKVRISIHSDCENCGICPGNNAMILDVKDEVGAKTGQRVVIKSQETNMLLAAFMIYMLPLLAIGLGVSLGYYLSSRWMIKEGLMMLLGGAIFGSAAVCLVKRMDKSMQAEKPIIVKTIK